jgi:hypothetical protein
MAAWHSHPRTSAFGAFDAGEDFGPGDALPGERIGPPVARTGRKLLWRGALLSVVLIGGWVLLGQRPGLQNWLSAQFANLLRLYSDARDSRRAAPAAAFVPAPLPVPPLTDPGPTIKSVARESPSLPMLPARSEPDASAAREPVNPPAVAPPQALPPAAEEPADPYQVRAQAVGLHPGLSRVLLMRLSAADYHNAGIAIRMALKDTPDRGALVWPRQRTPELAVFRVHFVPGAAPGCRRYVVTITKDGWSTTALPMERCGTEARVTSRK